MGIIREIWMPLLQKYQISCLLSFWQIGICHLLHIVFPKTIIITTSAKIIPNAIYTKNAGKIFSNTPIINRRIAITDIPIPIVLHSFFSLYFAFSSFEAVLYPEINQLPCPEIKTMESTASIIKPTYTPQSGPVDKSASFICITPPTKYRFS